MASQQTSNDVRDRYDITNEHQGQTASNILELQPPTDCEHTTGLDALIVVLRRIYTATMFGPHGLAQVEWVKAAEEENPILKHAWHVMGDSNEERLAANKARADLIATLGTEMNAGVASFKDLCTSPLMNKTFWSQVHLSLFWPTLYLPSGKVVRQSPEDRATTNLIHLNREHSPDLMLQQAIYSQFDVEGVDSQEVIRRPKYPLIIRVLLRTKNVTPENRVEFEDIRQFLLPQWIEREDEQGRFLDEDEPQLYTIIAVVRMRPDMTAVRETLGEESMDEEHQNDIVRTYAHNGLNIIAAYEDSALMPPYWSVGDLRPYPLEYMLFYMRKPGEVMDDPTGLPEHAQPPNFNMVIWENVNQVLDPLVDDLREKKRQSAEEHGPDGDRADVDMESPASEALAANHGHESKETNSTSHEGQEGRGERTKVPQPPQDVMFQRAWSSRRKQ
ncbi:hypothetical protein FOYG_11632 [Fusarium oxysporum NRRL 32931]|uniref:Uncharacterized protein n=1 Tax=Fusarium oxysporum NRRL 32931 TaxID=660029 RepID=W9HYP1_FUSOX|nr:hypothetical protein FOYG_11632 [Fusarium oxysporum NRRL 32931]